MHIPSVPTAGHPMSEINKAQLPAMIDDSKFNQHAKVLILMTRHVNKLRRSLLAGNRSGDWARGFDYFNRARRLYKQELSIRRITLTNCLKPQRKAFASLDLMGKLHRNHLIRKHSEHFNNIRSWQAGILSRMHLQCPYYWQTDRQTESDFFINNLLDSLELLKYDYLF